MAHGNVYFARLAIPVNRQPQRLLQLASHLGREHDVGHAVGIIKYLDTFPRKIVKRVRIGNVAIAFRPMRNRLAPRLEEGLLARPAGRKMHHLAISLDLHPLSVCHRSRMENRFRMRDPGSSSCSANAGTSTTSCPRPSIFQPFESFQKETNHVDFRKTGGRHFVFTQGYHPCLSASSFVTHVASLSFRVCTSENTAPNGSRADGK